MEKNRVKQIHDLGQSIWLDFIDRQIIKTGKLQELLNEDGVCGITSNPAIFEKAISAGHDYDDDIQSLSGENLSTEDIFFKIAVTDIQHTADVLKPIYEQRNVTGADGYVSLEVSPLLARDTEGTIRQANKLWKEVNRENLMIKIPGTSEGLPAIEQCISRGINVNVKLLFGLEQYKKVTEAYISALEKRAEKGYPLKEIACVASFFLSRIDVMVDPMLEQKNLSRLKSKTAIACAKTAYSLYQQIFSSERFEKLKQKGAHPQRLLWASTSSKDPEFKDTGYVEALIGKETVNTVPMDTLEAFRDHGIAAATLEQNMDEAKTVLDELQKAGIDLNDVSNRLEQQGIEKFAEPYNKLLQAIEKQTVA